MIYSGEETNTDFFCGKEIDERRIKADKSKIEFGF